MSSGPSLYRRHRPRTFADVVGQEHVVRTLSHAVERDAIHHAYLFVGSRGTGKTSMAKILAACLNCVDGPTVSPCGVCDSCVSIAHATSLDVIEMDAASNNSVDDIRDLREKVAYAPVSGRHKVYILDEAHMLSTQAWNAFLKTLEEPPPRTVFVLATTEAQKVLPTVVDRCHRFDFGRPSSEQVAEVVRRVSAAESIAIDDGAAALIARHATGSFRDALGTLEQLVTYAGGDPITPDDVLAVLGVADAEQLFAAVDAVIASDPAAALRAAAALAGSGRDPGQVLRDLEIHGRELLTVQIMGSVPAELRVTPDRDARLQAQAGQLAQTDAVRLLDLVSAALESTANGAQPRIQLELVLLKAAAPEMDPSVSALLARIERLERRGVAPGPAAAAGSAGRPATASVPAAPPPPPEPAQPSPAAEEPSSAGEPSPAKEPSSAPAEPGPSDPPAPTPGPPTEPAGESNATSTSDPALAVPTRPDPAPTAEPAVPDSGAGVGIATAHTLDLEEMTRVWPAVVAMVRGANAMLAVLLDGARPVAVTESELTLGWPPASDFYRRKAEQDEHRRATADALRNVTGAGLALRYTLLDEDAIAEAAAPEPEVPLSEDEVVRRFVEEFGAQEIPESDQEEA